MKSPHTILLTLAIDFVPADCFPAAARRLVALDLVTTLRRGSRMSLERVSQSELQDPGIVRTGNMAEDAGAEVGVGVAQIDPVQRVEALRAQLQSVMLRVRHRESLEQGKIEIRIAGSHHSVAA